MLFKNKGRVNFILIISITFDNPSRMSKSFNIGPKLIPDDGLPTTYAESWVVKKTELLLRYIEAYFTHMGYRNNEMIFLELFSGNGIKTIGNQSGKFTALNLSLLEKGLPFYKYCFCPVNEEDARALKVRVNKWHKDKNVLILEGNREELIDRIKLYLPKSNTNFKVGSLCLIDAFTLKMNYLWIDLLAEHGFDFLMVFTFPFSEGYNWKYYLNEERATLSKFLGSWNAVEKLQRASHDNMSFYKKLFELHQQDMKLLGYDCLPLSHKFESGLMNLPFYYTASFTKSVTAKTILKEMGEAAQTDLFNSQNE
jgi:three-Cys-motif partner protein